MIDLIDAAWLAGIIEGEGTFSLNSGKYPQVSVMMADRDIVDRCHTVTGFGTINGPINHPRSQKPLFTWQVSRKRDIARLLLLIYPMLGERRQRRVAEIVGPLAELRGRDEARCRTCGAEDWYRYPSGVRSCRPCQLRRVRARKAARRVA
jgi:hypothetical protein